MLTADEYRALAREVWRTEGHYALVIHPEQLLDVRKALRDAANLAERNKKAFHLAEILVGHIDYHVDDVARRIVAALTGKDESLDTVGGE